MPINDNDKNPSIISYASYSIYSIMNPPSSRCLCAMLLLYNSVLGSRDGVMPIYTIIYSTY